MTTDTAPRNATASTWQLGVRIRAVEPVYLQILEHLNDEALLLDHDEVAAWGELLATDLLYRAPVRLTRRRADGLGFDEAMNHCEDDYGTMMLRISRLTSTESAWAEDPPSRVRRFVTNVRVHSTDVDGEFDVTSYLLLLRSRWNQTNLDIVSAERRDLLRRAADGFVLARRTIYLDQSTLGTANLAVFL
jgi:3-phenylpropionate/cinnamic acid dioxygenase small subunit